MLQITISKRAAFIALVAVLLVIPVAAVATHVFDDVGDTSTHIDGITYLKDSGVSVGCDANNNFCPDDNVTRAQMGTFMYRLSGNDPATDASVIAANSDEVDGYDANELIRFAGDSESGNALAADGIAASVDITAPVRGFLVISASSDVHSSVTDDVFCQIRVNGALNTASARVISLETGNISENCSTDAYHTVFLPGDYTVEFEYASVSAGTLVDETVLNVIFIPFNGDGDAPGFIIVPLDE